MKKTLTFIGVTALLLGTAGVVWAGPVTFSGVQAPARPEPTGPVVDPQRDPPPHRVYAPARPSVPAEP